MTNRAPKYFDIMAAKKAYAEGQNITELLRAQTASAVNTPEIIEVAYDLQAGTYIEYVEQNRTQASLYAAELAAILNEHIGSQDSILDIGTGELTTLSLVTQGLVNKPSSIFAFDISWSRIYKGLAYAKKVMRNDYGSLRAFAADMGEIPLPDKSVNITISSHALEPNGGRLSELLSELFRITTDKLVLFEPCYELNNEEGKERMDKLGYIKNLDGVVETLGGKLLEKTRMENISNPLNPTVCFVIIPPPVSSVDMPRSLGSSIAFSVPGTDKVLKKVDEFYFSNETGLCFPILKSIPILKSSAAILASALVE